MTLVKQDIQPVAVPGIAYPKEVLAAATEQANVLMEVVEARKLYQIIGTKKYLEAEAWEIILAFNRAHPIPEWVKPIMEGDEIVGYIARVNIVQDGVIVSSGEMPCGFDDFPCRGKEGTAKHKAAMSAAQTWALSKAAKMKFAWVAVLGGFEPTPAEEMRQEVTIPAKKDSSSEFYCQKHDFLWFKRGKMRNYAHPLEGGGWCNMPKQTVDEDTPVSPAGSPAQPAQTVPPSQNTTSDVRQAISEGFATLGITTAPEQMKWIQMTCLVPDARRDWKPADYQTVADALGKAIAGEQEDGDAQP